MASKMHLKQNLKEDLISINSNPHHKSQRILGSSDNVVEKVFFFPLPQKSLNLEEKIMTLSERDVQKESKREEPYLLFLQWIDQSIDEKSIPYKNEKVYEVISLSTSSLYYL